MNEFPSVIITWPIKLKLGTKSKKDPHIKISGTPSMVDSARIKILEKLDPRRDKVTLKVDIDWTAHSHIIGKSGASIQAVMDKTGCHVHFPDANRTNDNDKSNQVSIAGTPTSVREARIAIRDLLPVIVWFTVILKSANRSVFMDRLNRVILLIERLTKTQITTRFNAKTCSMVTFLVRGLFRECNLVKVATDLLLNLMDDFFIKDDITYEMNTEIPGHHHSFVVGYDQSNLKFFMTTSGTTITFPDINESCLKSDIISRLTFSASEEIACAPKTKTTVNIKGSTVSSVLMAFQLIQLHLPLTLTFDLKEGQEVQTQTIETLSNHYKVGISVKPKPKQKSKTIWIKSAEKDEWKLFEVRTNLVDGSHISDISDISSITLKSSVTTRQEPTTIWSFPQANDIESTKSTISWSDHDIGFDKAPGAERKTNR